MEQKWFAHVLTSAYPLPAGMAVTAWGGYKIAWPAYESFDPKDKRLSLIHIYYVDIEFGTGCLKVTPAHDVNDYMSVSYTHLDVYKRQP